MTVLISQRLPSSETVWEWSNSMYILYFVTWFSLIGFYPHFHIKTACQNVFNLLAINWVDWATVKGGTDDGLNLQWKMQIRRGLGVDRTISTSVMIGCCDTTVFFLADQEWHVGIKDLRRSYQFKDPYYPSLGHLFALQSRISPSSNFSRLWECW